MKCKHKFYYLETKTKTSPNLELRTPAKGDVWLCKKCYVKRMIKNIEFTDIEEN